LLHRQAFVVHHANRLSSSLFGGVDDRVAFGQGERDPHGFGVESAVTRPGNSR
jgi:hypothetical protein